MPENESTNRLWALLQGGLFGLGAGVIVSTIGPTLSPIWSLGFGVVVISLAIFGALRNKLISALASVLVFVLVFGIWKYVPKPVGPATRKDFFDALSSVHLPVNEPLGDAGDKPITKEQLAQILRQYKASLPTPQSPPGMRSFLILRIVENLRSKAAKLHNLARTFHGQFNNIDYQASANSWTPQVRAERHKDLDADFDFNLKQQMSSIETDREDAIKWLKQVTPQDRQMQGLILDMIKNGIGKRNSDFALDDVDRYLNDLAKRLEDANDQH